MVITTATEAEPGPSSPETHNAWMLKFARDGHLTSSVPVQRSRGTTVSLTELFANFPVRRCELEKNKKRELSKTVALLQAYSLCLEGVRIICVTDKADGRYEELLRSEGRSLQYNTGALFGSEFLKSLKEVSFEAKIESDAAAAGSSDREGSDEDVVEKMEEQSTEKRMISVRGLVSESVGRTSNDRQFFFLNKRPVDLPKVAKCINSLFRSTLGQSKQAQRWQQYPAFVFMIDADARDFDINLTPDKRTVMFHRESDLLDLFTKELTKIWLPVLQTVQTSSCLSQPKLSSPASSSTISSRNITGSDLAGFSAPKSSPKGLKRTDTKVLLDSQQSSGSLDSSSDDESEPLASPSSQALTPRHVLSSPTSTKKTRYERLFLNDVVFEGASQSVQLSDGSVATVVQDAPHATVRPRTSIKTTVLDSSDVPSPPSLVEYTKEFPFSSCCRSHTGSCFTARIGVDNDDECVQELGAVFTQERFLRLEILGQFNLGFIIARDGDDLFIIDQHAADEIYNFEQLHKTTTLNVQPLLVPVPLELSPEDEILVESNLDVFKHHGLILQRDDSAEPGHRFSLKSCVYSKKTSFGVDDVHELVSVLREDMADTTTSTASSSQAQSTQKRELLKKQAYCLTRIRAMLASRACRKSIMIGTALSFQDMRRIVDHLATLDRPWRCPHGRPTIRHLASLTLLAQQIESPQDPSHQA